MNPFMPRIALGWIIVAAGCATAGPTETIEPTAPGSGGSRDEGFVLSRRPGAQSAGPADPIHTGDAWWPLRAKHLRMTEAKARARDADIPETHAPDTFWDEQTAVEAVALWTAVCNECHGGRRRLEDALAMPGPPERWGRGEGLFFGARRRYTDVFNVVYGGGPERNGVRSEMPAWRGKLAKELIWAVLYFLEYQSGGIEGRFPPSLYPRKTSTE
jgi:hypothetical protein